MRVAPALRISAWADENDHPREGERCCFCGSRRWWRPTEAEKRRGLGAGWRCAVCRAAHDFWEVEHVET